MSPLKWEQRSGRSTWSTYLSYLHLKTRSHLGTLNTVFLDVWISHKARYWLTQARHGLRLLPQFLGAFSQGQMTTHTGTVWSWGLCLSSLELSHKARCQFTQARSHCWLQHTITFLKSFFHLPTPISGFPLALPVFRYIAYICIVSISHIWEKTCDFYLSDPGLIHLTWCPPIASIYLQTTWFLSSL
jgi:hypothetical protein